MRFWDSSAIVSLLVEEKNSEEMIQIHKDDLEMLVWWGSMIECFSAVTRLERTNDISRESFQKAIDRLEKLTVQWMEVQPVEIIKELACRLIRVHPLHSADALQLAAAIAAAENRPATLDFICRDTRLSDAALKEGFTVL